MERDDGYRIVRIREELIVRRALEISHGAGRGSDLENWQQAERELSRDPWQEEAGE